MVAKYGSALAQEDDLEPTGRRFDTYGNGSAIGDFVELAQYMGFVHREVLHLQEPDTTPRITFPGLTRATRSGLFLNPIEVKACLSFNLACAHATR